MNLRIYSIVIYEQDLKSADVIHLQKSSELRLNSSIRSSAAVREFSVVSVYFAAMRRSVMDF